MSDILMPLYTGVLASVMAIPIYVAFDIRHRIKKGSPLWALIMLSTFTYIYFMYYLALEHILIHDLHLILSIALVTLVSTALLIWCLRKPLGLLGELVSQKTGQSVLVNRDKTEKPNDSE